MASSDPTLKVLGKFINNTKFENIDCSVIRKYLNYAWWNSVIK